MYIINCVHHCTKIVDILNWREEEIEISIIKYNMNYVMKYVMQITPI